MTIEHQADCSTIPIRRHRTPGRLRQFSTFLLDGLYFGVEVLSVQEVIQSQPITRVPLAPPAVHGLINLRGQIVTAIDLRRRMGLAGRPEGSQPMNVVIRTDDGAVSLLVDTIGDVLTVDESDIEAPPETLAGGVRDLTTGICQLEDRLLLTLDVDKAVDVHAQAS